MSGRCWCSENQHRIQPRGRGASNMKYMWPPLASIFLMTYLYRAGGHGPLGTPPLDPLLENYNHKGSFTPSDSVTVTVTSATMKGKMGMQPILPISVHQNDQRCCLSMLRWWWRSHSCEQTFTANGYIELDVDLLSKLLSNIESKKKLMKYLEFHKYGIIMEILKTSVDEIIEKSAVEKSGWISSLICTSPLLSHSYNSISTGKNRWNW